MRTIHAKAKQIKAKLSGDGSIRIFEEPSPGCLATVAAKMLPLVWFGGGMVFGFLAGLLTR